MQAVAQTLFVFGLLAWLYAVAIQITHPEWVPQPFTHYELAPLNLRLDDVGILAYAVATFGFFVWRLGKARQSSGSELAEC